MKRDSIPVCSVHDKFQTVNGRWLNKSEDFDNHIIFTQSQDAEILECPCDECDSPNQIKIDFTNVRPESEYKEVYDKVLEGGMFWEFHPEMTGKWELDKQAFIDYHTD